MKTRIPFLISAVALVLLFAMPGETQMSGRGGQISPNGGPRSGVFVPGLPIEPFSGRAYVDYTMDIGLPGLYRIDCVSTIPATFDPYLRLFMGGTQIAANDNGAGNNNARIQRILLPGRYVVRVTSARPGVVPAPTPFTLRVTSQTTPGGIPMLPIPDQLPIPTDIQIPQL